MSENSLSFVVKHDAPWSTIDMTLDAENDSAITIRFKVGELTGIPDPSLTDLRNAALSWAARRILQQLPEGYAKNGKPYLPGPRQPNDQ